MAPSNPSERYRRRLQTALWGLSERRLYRSDDFIQPNRGTRDRAAETGPYGVVILALACPKRYQTEFGRVKRCQDVGVLGVMSRQVVESDDGWDSDRCVLAEVIVDVKPAWSGCGVSVSDW